jgi:hypothetical protein
MHLYLFRRAPPWQKLLCHCFSNRASHRAAQGWSVASWSISEPALRCPGPRRRVACARSSTLCGQAQPEVRALARSRLRGPQGTWRRCWPTSRPPLARPSPALPSMWAAAADSSSHGGYDVVQLKVEDALIYKSAIHRLISTI